MLDDFGTSKVTIKKSALLETLRRNSDQHQRDFNLSWAGFLITAKEEMLKNLSALETTGKVHLTISIQTPSNHVKDYERVIRMLEMSVADEITISESQFIQYVQDEWSWKGSFTAMSTAYGAKVGAH